MSTEEKPQVPEEPKKTAPEEPQEEVCEKQQRRGQYVAGADNTESPKGIDSIESEPTTSIQFGPGFVVRLTGLHSVQYKKTVQK